MAKTPVVVKDGTADTSIKKPAKAKTVKSEITASSIEDEVDYALDSNDPLEISKVQLKLLLSIATNLNKIDWKLWEFYNRIEKQ